MLVSKNIEKVFIIAPTAGDADAIREVLNDIEIHSESRVELNGIHDDVLESDVLVLSEEGIDLPDFTQLVLSLKTQPAWSELPIIFLASSGGPRSDDKDQLAALGSGNVTVLERPMGAITLQRSVLVALRSRRRQYQVRDLLESERVARGEAERATRLKDDFLATVSHELRSPLNAILGWASLLQRPGADQSTIGEGLEVIVRSARTQARLIEDLLDLSRIVSGKIQLDIRSVDLITLIDQAVETVRPAAQAKEIRINRDLKAMDGVVRGDVSRLQQVLWNLFSNAVKFTPRGGLVQISLRLVEGQAEIEVIDTGKGIKAEFLPHAFERFRQEDSSSTRTHGGLGLGLSIVKHITELHGGTVTVHSEGVDRGASFKIRLPVSKAFREPRTNGFTLSAPGRNFDLHNARVLVVDDDVSACEMMRRILMENNARVDVAYSTHEAMEKISNVMPDLLIGDIGMPGRDGYDLIRSVRASGVEGVARVPAVAVTAFARSQDRIAALAAGFNLHITKPIEPDELLAAAATMVTISNRSEQSN